MIDTTTIRSMILLFLACTILYATATITEDTVDNGSNKGIRGSSSSSSVIRSLVVEENDMVCKHVDGSVTCTFRADVKSSSSSDIISSSNHIFKKCLYSDDIGGPVCISTTAEIFLPPTVDGKIDDASSSTTTTTTTTTTVHSNLYPVGTNGKSIYNMKCPAIVPKSGTLCGGWLPTGANYGKCVYPSSDFCECDNQNGIITDPALICWDCNNENIQCSRINTETTTNTVVDAEIYSGPAATSSSTTNNRVDQIALPKPINGDWCPDTKPKNGDECEELRRCAYLDNETNPTKIIDCKCSTAKEIGVVGFVCNDAVHEIYSINTNTLGLGRSSSYSAP